MQYCAWDARLSAPVETGGTVRSNAEVAAALGNARAIATLQGPPFPAGMEYLWEWHVELTQGLGFDMNGRASLSWPTFDAWARWSGAKPYAHEARALFALDAVSRNPDALPVIAEPEDAD